MTDWGLKAAEAGIRLTGSKRRQASAERTRARVERRARRPRRAAPGWAVRRGIRVQADSPAGMPVYELRAIRARPGAGPIRVLYLHGGGYTAEISFFHWRFIAGLARATGATISVPIYELAPRSPAVRTVARVVDVLSQTMTQTMAEAPHTRLVLMGDSAGGGLALAAAQHLAGAGEARPAAIILISPWLDLTMSDPRQAELERRDVMLSRPGMRESARLYAGDLQPRDPRVSPLFGSMDGLAPIDVFTGTAELLNPEAHELARRCAQAGVACRLHEAEGMPHGFPLVPLLAQARAARAEIAALITG